MPDRDPAERVVITGAGCVSPLGTTVQETWAAAVDGRSGAGTISAFDPEGIACTIAAEVKGEIDLGIVPPKEARRMDRVVRFALAAMHEAVGDAGLVLYFDGGQWNEEFSTTLSSLIGVWATPGTRTMYSRPAADFSSGASSRRLGTLAAGTASPVCR